MADAKSPSPYEIVIFGGIHADLPITSHAGAIIADSTISSQLRVVPFEALDEPARLRPLRGPAHSRTA
jgi:hypothetical protein